MRFLLPAIVTLILFHVVAANAHAADRPVAFVGVSVLSMTSESIFTDQTVIVRDGLIAEVGPSEKVKIPRKAVRIDAQGKFLIPGLMDMHAHLFGGRKGNPILLKLFALNGVTTILNMRGTRGALDAREQIASGELFGPTLFSTSPILGNISPEPKTFEAGVEAVERYAKEGYDFMKVYNFIPKEGYEGIMSAAKRLGIPVVGHAVRSVGIEGAIQNGQHIAHMEEVVYGHFADGLDEPKIAPLMARFKEAEISIVATLIVYHNIIRQVEDLDKMLASPGIEYIPAGMLKPWLPDRNEYTNNFDMDSVERRLGPQHTFHQKLAKACVDAGVPLLLGTDAPVPITIPGYSAHLELEELVDAGLTPYQALVAGTTAPAAFLGIEDEVGTIEKGKRADLILLDASPLDDIRNTQRRAGVVLRGQWLSKEAIQKMLDEIRRPA